MPNTNFNRVTDTCQPSEKINILCQTDDNGYGILPKNRTKVEVFKWEKGRGKSFQSEKLSEKFLSEGKKVHIITPKIILTKKAAKSHERLVLYTERPDSKESVATTIHSYPRIAGNPDLLIIDEIEQVLQAFNTKLIDPHKGKDIRKLLIHRMKQAEKVILLDANASQPTMKLIEQAGLLEHTQILLCPEKERPWIDVGSNAQHDQFCLQELEAGKKLFIGTLSEKDAQIMGELFRKRFPDHSFLVVTGSNIDDTIKKRGDRFYEGLDCLIASPVIDSGYSINCKNHFDQVHIKIHPMVGDARNATQMSGRVRHPKTPTIYFSGPNQRLQPAWNFSAEKLLDGWLKKEKEIIRVVQGMGGLDTTYEIPSRDMKFLELKTEIEAEAQRNGKGAVAAWLRQHKRTLAILGCKEDESYEADKKASKEACNRKRAEQIIEACDLPEDIAERNRMGNNQAIHERFRLEETYGKEIVNKPRKLKQEIEQLTNKLAELDRDKNQSEETQTKKEKVTATFKQKKREQAQAKRRLVDIIRKDKNQNLTRKTKSFAEVTLFQSDEGKKALVREDNHQLHHYSIESLEGITIKGGLRSLLLTETGILKPDGTWETEAEIQVDKVRKAKQLLYNNREHFKRYGITPTSQPPMKWLSSFLNSIGLGLCLSRREQKEGIRIRYQKLNLSKLEEMGELSRFHINSRRYIPSSNQQHEEVATSTDNKHIKKSWPLSNERREKAKGDAAYAALASPSLSSLERACSSLSLGIDVECWNELKDKYERKNSSKEKERSDLIVEHIDRCIKTNRDVTFTNLGKLKRCPRRYPLVTDGEFPLLLSREKTEKIAQKINLANLPKMLRPALKAPSGMTLIDLDLDRCHLSILAMLSKDELMHKWLKGDPHQDTGDLMLSKVEDVSIRRKIGKRLNSALVSGGGPGAVAYELEEAGYPVDRWEEAEELFQDWWKRFPKAFAYREQHKNMIAENVAKGEKHVLSWNDAEGKKVTLAYFDHGVLAGKVPIKDWPDSVESRRVKAERSAFTALLRSFERMIMDLLFIKAHDLGLKLVCPMYDGAVWAAPIEGAHDLALWLEGEAIGILRAFGLRTGVSISIRQAWGAE